MNQSRFSHIVKQVTPIRARLMVAGEPVEVDDAPAFDIYENPYYNESHARRFRQGGIDGPRAS